MRWEGDAELRSSGAFWDVKPLLQVAAMKFLPIVPCYRAERTILSLFDTWMLPSSLAMPPDAVCRRLTCFPKSTAGGPHFTRKLIVSALKGIWRLFTTGGLAGDGGFPCTCSIEVSLLRTSFAARCLVLPAICACFIQCRDDARGAGIAGGGRLPLPSPIIGRA
jgi:hypothetical protein